MSKGRAASFFRGLAIVLFWRIGSFILSLPAWVMLILHFAVGLSIWWFWGLLGAWLLVGILRFLLLRFMSRRVGYAPPPHQENVNPYSKRK